MIVGKQSELLKQRRLMLFGPVDRETVEGLCSQALFLGSHTRKQPITLYINSPGGSVSDGLALLDCLSASCTELYTVAVGMAASMAAVLLAGGTPGRRYIAPNATVMLHQVSGGCWGSAPDITRQCAELQRTNEHMISLLSRFTGKDQPTIKADIDRDLWLTPQSAVDYGVADHITN